MVDNGNLKVNTACVCLIGRKVLEKQQKHPLNIKVKQYSSIFLQCRHLIFTRSIEGN